MAQIKYTKIRGKLVSVNAKCPHLSMPEWADRYHLPYDADEKYNSCALCAAEAASQVEGGMPYEEIAELEGITKMAAVFVERRAIKKISESKTIGEFEFLRLSKSGGTKS